MFARRALSNPFFANDGVWIERDEVTLGFILELEDASWRTHPHVACSRPHLRCWARCLFISNIVTDFLPNTFSSLSSALISRLFCGFWRLFFLM